MTKLANKAKNAQLANKGKISKLANKAKKKAFCQCINLPIAKLANKAKNAQLANKGKIAKLANKAKIVKTNKRPILAEVRSNVSDEVYIALGSDHALQQLMRRQKNKMYGNVNCADLDNMVIPDYLIQKYGSSTLISDSRTERDGNDVEQLLTNNCSPRLLAQITNNCSPRRT